MGQNWYALIGMAFGGAVFILGFSIGRRFQEKHEHDLELRLKVAQAWIAKRDKQVIQLRHLYLTLKDELRKKSRG